MGEVIGVDSLNSEINRLQREWFTEEAVIIIADTDYAVYVEFGTYKMAAQPYMRPAAEYAAAGAQRAASRAESAEELVKLIGEDVREYADRVVPVDTGYLKSQISLIETDSAIDAEVTEWVSGL